MKRSFVPLFLFAVIFVSGCTDGNYKKFDGTLYSIDYPTNWEVDEQPNNVAFVSPYSSEDDEFRENVVVSIQDVQPGLTLKDYADDTIAVLESTVDDFNLVDADDVFLDDNPAYLLTYTGTLTQDVVGVFQVYTIKDDNFYIITYVGTGQDYLDYFDVTERMISSFSIKSDSGSSKTKAQTTIATSSYPELEGKWRVYSEAIFYDEGGNNFLETPTTRLLELKKGGKWTFGDSSGTWTVEDITDEDWSKWGVRDYGPTRKIVLYDWDDDVSDGPIEETASRVDFIWVIYHAEPPIVSKPGQIQMKFGWTYSG